MPDHVRKQIRAAVVAAVTGLTTTGTNVFVSRQPRIEDDEYPCLLVYTLEEESEIDTMNRPRGLERSVDVAIEAVEKGTTGVDDTLDTIAKEVEAALGNNLLGGLVKDLWLSSTKFTFDGEAKKVYGAAQMIWQANYRTPEDDPTTTR